MKNRNRGLVFAFIFVFTAALLVLIPSASAYYRIAGNVGEGWDIENAVVKLFYDNKLIQTKYLVHQNRYIFDVDQPGYYLIKTNITSARANDSITVRVAVEQPKLEKGKMVTKEVLVTEKDKVNESEQEAAKSAEEAPKAAETAEPGKQEPADGDAQEKNESMQQAQESAEIAETAEETPEEKELSAEKEAEVPNANVKNALMEIKADNAEAPKPRPGRGALISIAIIIAGVLAVVLWKTQAKK